MPDAATSVPVVAPTKELDIASSRELGQRLAELAGSPGDAVLDLTQVGFMDSVGLAVVMKASSRFSRQGKSLLLVIEPEGNVDRVLQLAGMRGRLNVVATRDEALERASTPR
jgi:anti-sigma B factor antagonist